MDIQMPDMDGLEAARRIRALENPARLSAHGPMTACAMKGDREKCLEAGLDSYISKPIQIAASTTRFSNTPNPAPDRGAAASRPARGRSAV